MLGLREWLRVLIDPDNPLTAYYSLAEKRRRAAIPAWRRHGLLLLTAALAVGLFALLADGGELDANTIEATFLLMVAIPTWYVWLLQGLHTAALSAMSLLGVGGRRQLHLAVDDMLALSLLTDREVVAGALRVLVPPLLTRAVGGAMLVWTVAVLIASELGAQVASSKVALVLTLAPVTIAGVGTISALALTLLVLWWIALGRGQRTAAALSSTHVALQALFLPGWIMLSVLMLNEDFLSATEWPHLVLPLAALALPGLLWLALAGAERLLPIRAALAVTGPLGLPIVLFLLIPFLEFTFGLGLDESSIEVVLPGMLWSFVSLMPISVCAVPLAECLPQDMQMWSFGGSGISVASPEFWLLLLLLQLGLLLLFARSAVQAVALHRRENP